MGLGELDKYATFNGPETDTGRSRLDRVRLQVETEKKAEFYRQWRGGFKTRPKRDDGTKRSRAAGSKCRARSSLRQSRIVAQARGSTMWLIEHWLKKVTVTTVIALAMT